MNKKIENALALPGGTEPLDFRDGALFSRKSGVRIPVFEGMPLFVEAGKPDGFDDGGRYAEFVREKFRRPVYDAYAAFQPFNESIRAALPFLPYLSAPLKSGDVILDLSNRNGWSGEMLAGLFPEQRVISMWDGNSGVLGYAGFAFWLGEKDRAPNLTFAMQPAGEGLPVPTGSVKLIVGYDCLHRYDASKLLDECLRAMAPEATMIFPHVHLESDTPQFERGGTHLSAKAYRALLDEKLANGPRAGFVFSERRLFENGYPAVKDDSGTSHYNGLVFIGPKSAEGKPTATSALPAPQGPWRLLPNPLCAIDLHRRRAEVGAANLGDQGTHMLSRHPVYRERMERCLPRDLSTPECEILYWASRCLTLAQIAERTNLPLAEVLAAARRLEESEVALAYPVTEAMARLHHYYATQRFLAPRAKQTIDELWRQATRLYADRKLFVYAADESEFAYGDAQQVVERVAQALAKAGLKKGDVIAADADLNPEFALLFWAAMLRGLVVAPMNTGWPDETTANVIRECGAKLVFLQARRTGARAGSIVFDSSVEENAAAPGRLFSEWLETAEDGEALPPVANDERDVALMIFTSGTTGLPKGAKLSHGALYRSGRTLSQEYGWTKDDVLLIPGEFHSMSGLRSPLIAMLHVGGSFVLTTQAQRRHPLSVLPVVQKTGATILTVTPAFLLELGKARERVPDVALPTVRLVLSTASALTPAAAAALQPFRHLTLGNYYGLTESCGASVFVPAVDTTGTRPWEPGLIGRPAGVIVHIVDEQGERLPPGTVGEVCFYSENVMSEYLNNPQETAHMLRRGWLYSGDLGVLMPDGQVALKGRKREIIKDDFGDILSPLEIEAVIGGDAGVDEAAVCGLTEPSTGREALAAFVVPKSASASPEDLVNALKNRIQAHLGVRKVPKHFDIVDKLPRNSLGKVVKRELVEAFLKKRNGT